MKNLIYTNQNATRNKPVTDYLFKELSDAIYAVYGPDYVGHIYSGGQDKRGTRGAKRVGTVRHDLGRAADVHIYHKTTKVQVKGVRLAPLAQYWVAKGIGGVGIEMSGGGIHLDEWAKPPQRGAMFWYYKHGRGTQTRTVQIKAVEKGARGILPPIHTKTAKGGFTALIAAIASIFRGKRT